MKAIAVASLLCAASVFAAGRNTIIEPGTYGPNALAVWPGESPLIADKIDVQVGAAAQVGHYGDSAATPLLRLDIPFGAWAQATLDTQPVEAWWATPKLLAAYGTTQTSGVTKGDLRFQAKFLLVNGASERPSLGLRLFTKTTTGKDTLNRRFIDAPGYLVDALIGWPFALPHGFVVEVDATLGFFAWQQGSLGQNDAVQGSASVTLQRGLWFVTAEGRGYAGWQRSDKPIVATLRGGLPVATWLRVLAAVNAGFIDAPPLDVRFSLEFRLPWKLPIPIR